MLEKMKNFLAEEEGQGVTEYALILFFVVVAAIGGVELFGSSVENLYTHIKTEVIKALG